MHRTDATFTGDKATARGVVSAAGHCDAFIASHRQDNTTPVLVELTMTVPMSAEDIAAIVYTLVYDCDDADFADFLSSDEEFRAMVGELVFGHGALGVEDAQTAAGAIKRGTRAHRRLQQIRQRVHELYGPPPAATPRQRTARRRELATTAG